MGTGELPTHVLIHPITCVTQGSSLSTGFAPDMLSYQDKHLGTICGYQAGNKTTGLMQMLW